LSFVLLLGAGFSKWAADLPVARQLFDFNIEPFGIRERRNLVQIRAVKEAWESANPGGEAERFIEHAFAVGGVVRDLVQWYVQRRLVAPFIFHERHAARTRRHVLQIDERSRVDERGGVVEVREFLELCRPDGIVTTNYDMLVEYALGTSRFHYGEPGQVLSGRGPYPVSRFTKPVELTGRLPLLKLHGSISWDKDGRFADGRRGLTGRALIVAPVPEKIGPAKLENVWAAVRRLLHVATRLIAFGVGFNPYDEAILELLRSAPVASVLLIDVTPKVAAAQSLWPAARVESALPPPAGDTTIKEWLGRFAGA
jgi:hypothetical protein